MVASPDDACEVTVISSESEIKEEMMVVLTISSYLFRLVVLIYFTRDDATREHIARGSRINASEMSEQAFYDSISEFGNVCCGILNRGLAGFFPHIGMSTPNIIHKDCSTYLKRLGCGHIQHFKVKINDSVRFHVGLCVSDYADLDFVVDTAQAESGTGELELF